MRYHQNLGGVKLSCQPSMTALGRLQHKATFGWLFIALEIGPADGRTYPDALDLFSTSPKRKVKLNMTPTPEAMQFLTDIGRAVENMRQQQMQPGRRSSTGKALYLFERIRTRLASDDCFEFFDETMA